MAAATIKRLLHPPERSFFLFGPRGVGKSTWLRENYPGAVYVDLLDPRETLGFSRDPGRLAKIVARKAEASWVVIDEIQKNPWLLDEVHRLMEIQRLRFALCGSSARKLRRGGTNLLAGRAVTRDMEAFCSEELGEAFDLEAALQWGCLPKVQLDRVGAAETLNAYVNTYIKEEIKEEGFVRSLPPFLRFLSVAGQLNGQLVNALNIARDAYVSRSSVDAYFSILEDTLLGHFLPSYRPSVKVREVAHPKFYWFDPGVARAAAGLIFDPMDRLWAGSAFETLLFHELRVYNQVGQKHRAIAFYRTTQGSEIDFVVETQKRRPTSPAHVVCIEAKLAERWDQKWENAMRSLRVEPKRLVVDRMFGVYTGERAYHSDGVDVLPVRDFLRKLYQGEVF